LQSKTITEFSGKQWTASALRRRCITCVQESLASTGAPEAIFNSVSNNPYGVNNLREINDGTQSIDHDVNQEINLQHHELQKPSHREQNEPYQDLLSSNSPAAQIQNTKECVTCLQSKTITEFSGKQWTASALRRRCITCVQESLASTGAPEAIFNSVSNNPYGVNNLREINDSTQSIDHNTNQQIQESAAQVQNTKECVTCLQFKTIAEFSGKQWNANSLRRRCIDCVKESLVSTSAPMSVSNVTSSIPHEVYLTHDIAIIQSNKCFQNIIRFKTT